MKRIALACALVGLPAAAAADTVDGPLFDSISLDRQSPVSKIDIDFGYVSFDEPPNTDATAIGITIGGQFVDPHTGFGGYAVLPLSYVGYEFRPIIGPTQDDSAFLIGNAELGGIFSKWMSARWALVFHGGVALPTADDDDPLRLSAIAASSPRYTDVVQRIPDATWLRLGFSPMGRQGGLFWRADLGVDIALNDDNNAGDIAPILRLGFGGGFDLGKAQLMAELAFVTIDDDRPNDDDTSGTLALGARFNAGNVFPGIALILPVEFENRGNFEPELAIALSLAAHL